LSRRKERFLDIISIGKRRVLHLEAKSLFAKRATFQLLFLSSSLSQENTKYEPSHSPVEEK
jgi:hypothetical protein